MPRVDDDDRTLCGLQPILPQPCLLRGCAALRPDYSRCLPACGRLARSHHRYGRDCRPDHKPEQKPYRCADSRQQQQYPKPPRYLSFFHPSPLLSAPYPYRAHACRAGFTPASPCPYRPHACRVGFSLRHLAGPHAHPHPCRAHACRAGFSHAASCRTACTPLPLPRPRVPRGLFPCGTLPYRMRTLTLTAPTRTAQAFSLRRLAGSHAHPCPRRAGFIPAHPCPCRAHACRAGFCDLRSRSAPQLRQTALCRARAIYS